ncbi:dipeptide/oligopeptide/nickel ABC transporter ATP-binding protein [uncultured Methanospirillum sp.]|uniref:ABC transporter ATP-binding protein n=1 Tax=uncultured Methanospirillum sp. TaxID=262503 RepID=UPI0029C60FB7|nr:dipeptide/oligopeptide/nickel ABC transporter ATP-binding protein [uncultured Methanospirillum sp.]
MSPPVLQLKNLTKSYGHGNVFTDISFTVSEAESVGLFGESGCGKTTLGRCIMQLEKQSAGTILLDSLDPTRLSSRKRRESRQFYQMIFQHPEVSLNPKMTLAQSVTELLLVHKKISFDEAMDAMQPLIKRVGLRNEHLVRYPHQLSGGEVQRAVLARIFSLQPKLIIADEPTSMLDVSVQAQVLRLMKDLQKETGVAYVFISHDPDVISAMCDQIFWLSKGGGILFDKAAFIAQVKEEYVSSLRAVQG